MLNNETRFMPASETRFTSTPRVRAFRKRERRGLRRLAVLLTSAQIDALEEKGYLDPDQRGERADEAEAVETFLTDFLVCRRPATCRRRKRRSRDRLPLVVPKLWFAGICSP
jgi:hypothetical protein